MLKWGRCLTLHKQTPVRATSVALQVQNPGNLLVLFTFAVERIRVGGRPESGFAQLRTRIEGQTRKLVGTYAGDTGQFGDIEAAYGMILVA